MGLFSPKPPEPGAREARSRDGIPPKLLPLFIIGISLNTLGITIRTMGPLRWVFMAVGLAMLLTFVVKVSQHRGKSDEPG